MKALTGRERIGAVILAVVTLGVLSLGLVSRCHSPKPVKPAEVVIIVPDTVGKAAEDSVKAAKKLEKAEKKREKHVRDSIKKAERKAAGKKKQGKGKSAAPEKKPRNPRSEIVGRNSDK